MRGKEREDLFEEGGAGVGGGVLAANDMERFRGAGECNIEQVEVIDHVLEVFIMIVSFINCAEELFGTIVDRCQGQSIEGGLVRLAPEDMPLF